MPEEVKTEQVTDQDLKEREKKLNDFQAKLLAVHKQLEPQVKIFNALKEQGIDSVESLNSALATPTTTEPAGGSSEDTSLPDTTSIDKSEISKLKEMVQKQNETIQQMAVQNHTRDLLGKIQSEIKDNPEYAHLSKVVDEQIAFNIFRSMEQDRQNNNKQDLSVYLKATEGQLKTFYNKMGGSLESEKKSEAPKNTVFGSPNPFAQNTESIKESKPIAQGPSAPSTQNTDKPIDFPTLPGSGTAPDEKKDFKAHVLQMGKNPVTGKFDEDQAFDNYVKEAGLPL